MVIAIASEVAPLAEGPKIGPAVICRVVIDVSNGQEDSEHRDLARRVAMSQKVDGSSIERCIGIAPHEQDGSIRDVAVLAPMPGPKQNLASDRQPFRRPDRPAWVEGEELAADRH